MNQSERLNRLIEYFLSERSEYRDIEVPDDYNGKQRLLRSLMNVRMPSSAPEDIISIQDEFLKTEAEEKGIVTLSDIPLLKDNISLWQGDITRLEVDAIVNAANSALLGCFVPCHGCIDNAIHSAAGIEMREECEKIMEAKRKHYGIWYEEPNGRAIITKGYNLPAKHVIHTVGPVVQGAVTSKNREDLASSYESCLSLAYEHKLESIAFCCISTGEFHYPNKDAAMVAITTVEEFIRKHPDAFERVIFNVFKDEDLRIYRKLLA